MPISQESSPIGEARRRVQDRVSKLDLDFKLEEHEELWGRLAETGEHFEDAVCMARMIDAVWPKLEIRGMTREKMMLCALLHDIGKSGPETKSASLKKAIRKLFVTPRVPFNPFKKVNGRQVQKTISDYMRETEMTAAASVQAILAEELDIDSETKPILEFWRDHADWTYAVLQRNRGGSIDDEVIVVASTHHILEGRNPARIPLDDIHPGSKVLELMDKYETLAIVDKYQAFRGRGGLDHAKAIERLKEMVDGQKDLPEKVRQDYRRIISVLESSEKELARALMRE